MEAKDFKSPWIYDLPARQLELEERVKNMKVKGNPADIQKNTNTNYSIAKKDMTYFSNTELTAIVSGTENIDIPDEILRAMTPTEIVGTYIGTHYAKQTDNHAKAIFEKKLGEYFHSPEKITKERIDDDFYNLLRYTHTFSYDKEASGTVKMKRSISKERVPYSENRGDLKKRMNLVSYDAKLRFINSFSEGLIEENNRSEALQKMFDRNYKKDTMKSVAFESLKEVYKKNQR
jgi:hypothetical protein